MKEYRPRLRSVLSSQLNDHNKIITINSYAVPVLRYFAGIVSWSLNDLDEIDYKTRKPFIKTYTLNLMSIAYIFQENLVEEVY